MRFSPASWAGLAVRRTASLRSPMPGHPRAFASGDKTWRPREGRGRASVRRVALVAIIMREFSRKPRGLSTRPQRGRSSLLHGHAGFAHQAIELLVLLGEKRGRIVRARRLDALRPEELAHLR